MKKILFLASFILPALIYAADVDDLDKRVTDLEIKNLQNRVNFSGSFDNYLDVYSDNNKTSNTRTSTYAARFRFALNANVDVTKNLKVYTTMSVRQVYNTQNWMPNGTTDELTTTTDYFGYAFSNSRFLFLEKAYFDYSLESIPLTFSAGRLSTMNGPPSHLKDGINRQGTYPMLAFSGAIDGFALSFDFTKYLKQDLKFRLIWSPFFTYNQNTPWAVTWSGRSGAINPTNWLSFMFDYNNKNLGFVENLNFISQNIMAKFGAKPDFASTTTLLGQTISGTVSTDKETAFLNYWINYLELTNIAKTNLDFYISESFTYVKPTGSYYFTFAATAPIAAYYTSKGIPTAVGTSMTRNIGSILSDGVNPVKDFAGLVGLRYGLPISWTSQIGFEFISAGPRSFVPGWVDDQVIGMFASLRGEGIHTYLNHPIMGGAANLRIGYYRIMRNRSTSLIGGSITALNETVDNLYLAFKIRF